MPYRKQLLPGTAAGDGSTNLLNHGVYIVFKRTASAVWLSYVKLALSKRSCVINSRLYLPSCKTWCKTDDSFIPVSWYVKPWNWKACALLFYVMYKSGVFLTFPLFHTFTPPFSWKQLHAGAKNNFVKVVKAQQKCQVAGQMAKREKLKLAIYNSTQLSSLQQTPFFPSHFVLRFCLRIWRRVCVISWSRNDVLTWRRFTAVWLTFLSSRVLYSIYSGTLACSSSSWREAWVFSSAISCPHGNDVTGDVGWFLFIFILFFFFYSLPTSWADSKCFWWTQK